MNDPTLYHEVVSSKKTTNLFIALAAVFLILAAWRVIVTGLDTLTIVFVSIGCLFVFYVFNFRILEIDLTAQALKLKFGLFHWTIPLSNIASCQHDDDLPWLMKNGGAGIHFMLIRNRYRASFNFLEYPRVVVALKKPAGPVVDLSFTTRHPDELIQQVEAEITANYRS